MAAAAATVARPKAQRCQQCTTEEECEPKSHAGCQSIGATIERHEGHATTTYEVIVPAVWLGVEEWGDDYHY